MSDKDLRGELSDIFEGACKVMKNKLENPDEVTAADLNVIRGFLKDNNVTAVPVKGTSLGDLVETVQEQTGERYSFPFALEGAGSLLPESDPRVKKVSVN